MPPDNGTPIKPVPVRSMGVGTGEGAYLSIVAKDGRQFHFDVSEWRRAELISDKLGDYARRARDADERARSAT